jgi:hypothetical protein
MRQRSVSPPRSSNRTCRFPASGFPTGFIARHTPATFHARDKGITRAVLRRHARKKTASCRAPALCVVCAGNCARDHRHDRQRPDTPMRERHGRSKPTSRSTGVSRLIANYRLLAIVESVPEVRVLSSAGITRPRRYYDPCPTPARSTAESDVAAATSDRTGLPRLPESPFQRAVPITLGAPARATAQLSCRPDL